MQEAPISPTEAKGLRSLRILVNVLTLTMIGGFLTIVGLFVIRLGAPPAALPLPESIELPADSRATAFTRGNNWYAVVTDNDEILIYDARDHSLRQRITISLP